MDSEILQIQKEIQKNPQIIEEIIKNAKEKAMENQKECNSFVTLIDEPKTENLKGTLYGIPYGLKDNFSTKGILTTASSKTLSNYVPVYNATVYEKLQKAGAILIGKTTMDEFGLGATGTTAHTGVVKNPYDKTKQAGGSSAGSAASVAAGVYPFAIGSDTGDSVRKPAAYCGIVGYKPTYGLISRYGLLPFASSLDHVGVLTNHVKDAAIIVDAIKGKDDKDMTSIDSSGMKLAESCDNPLTPKKLFFIKEILDIENYENPSEELKKSFNLFFETLEKAKQLGIEIVEESIDKNLLNAIPATYTCISCAEATSNLSNLTGIIFGPRASNRDVTKMMQEHRTEGFSPLIKRRLVIGSYVLQKENQEKYFLNAQRIRRLIVDKMNELFKKYDALILPCSEGGAKSLESVNDMLTKESLILENHMVIGNFGGFPSITIPNGYVNNLPVGINLTSKVKDDENLLNIAANLEKIIGFKKNIGGK